MNYQDFILKIKDFIDAVAVDIKEMNDMQLLILYLKIGSFLNNHIRVNNLNKNKTLLATFASLKTEFNKIQIINLKGVKALCQLSSDYNKLDLIKRLLKQISIENKILVIQNAQSIEAMINNIKNSVQDHLYIDKHTKLYYYNQLEKRDDAELSFKETIRLLYIFK